MNILNENNKIVDYKYLEELFTDLQVKNNIDRTLNSMKKVLNSSFDATCVDVVIGNKSNKLYGMSVYPSNESLEKIMSVILKGKSQEITKVIVNSKMEYIVEIDPNMLWNPLYKFTTGELVAMLLHEIGHVTADSDFYNDLALAYRDAVFNMEQNKAVFGQRSYNYKDIQLGILFLLSSIESTNLVNSNRKGIMNEHIADTFVVQNGYGEQLISALNKISKIYLKNSNVTMNEYRQKLRLEGEAYYTLQKNFKLRKKYVEELIDAEEKTTHSSYIAKTLSELKNQLFGKRTRFFLKEGVLINPEFLDESFLNKLRRSPLKISQMDIDELKIEAEMMEDWDDKSILVYKIHKRLTQLANLKTKDNVSDYELNIANQYEKQLNELLKKVMEFKKVDKTYGVFIKYPKGYEG